MLAAPAEDLFTNEFVTRDPAFRGLDVHLQAIGSDAEAAKGFSFTPGLGLLIGN